MDKMQLTTNEINNKIYTIRNIQVMLDSDLAELYQVELKRLNEQVKRNIKRFPENFRFQLSEEEYEILRSQIATLRLNSENNWGKHRKYLPYVFTEQGVSMLSAVLKSDTAIETSIKIIDSFVNMRKFLSTNANIFQRLENIESKQLQYQQQTDDKFDKIFKAIESKQIKPTQGIFYDGQIFDAYNFISDMIRSAKQDIILIDNYIDDTVLTIFSKIPNIKVTIYTHTISKQLKLDLEKYNKQYDNITIKIFKNSHDRFMIIDKKELYHLGASLKDLGKKWFAFSKMDIGNFDVLGRLN